MIVARSPAVLGVICKVELPRTAVAHASLRLVDQDSVTTQHVGTQFKGRALERGLMVLAVAGEARLDLRRARPISLKEGDGCRVAVAAKHLEKHEVSVVG